MNKYILAAVIACAMAGPALAYDDFIDNLRQQQLLQIERDARQQEMWAIEADALTHRLMIESEQQRQQQQMRALQDQIDLQSRPVWSPR